jgi:hypothetical protein
MRVSEVRNSDVFKNMSLSGWCKNGVFVAQINDNQLFLVDTYFHDKYIQINNDEDLNDFTFIANKNDLEVAYDADEYNEEDLYYLVFNSGGWRYGASYYIKKGTERNKKLIYEKLLLNVTRAESNLKYAKKYLDIFLKENPNILEEVEVNE